MHPARFYDLRKHRLARCYRETFFGVPLDVLSELVWFVGRGQFIFEHLPRNFPEQVYSVIREYIPRPTQATIGIVLQDPLQAWTNTLAIPFKWLFGQLGFGSWVRSAKTPGIVRTDVLDPDGQLVEVNDDGCDEMPWREGHCSHCAPARRKQEIRHLVNNHGCIRRKTLQSPKQGLNATVFVVSRNARVLEATAKVTRKPLQACLDLQYTDTQPRLLTASELKRRFLRPDVRRPPEDVHRVEILGEFKVKLQDIFAEFPAFQADYR